MSHLSSLAMGTLASVLILNCTSFVFAQPGASGGAPTRVAVVAGAVSETVPVAQKKYVGNVEAIEQVDSVARVSGTLKVASDFEEGSHVSKGQLLFEIDPIPYQAEVDASLAAIQETEARIEYAQSNYNRLNDLFEKNAGSRDAKENAFSLLQSLKAQLASAQAKLTLARENLKYTKVYAELDGRAGRRAYSSGAYVSPQSQPLLRVVQMDPIYVRFTMSERDFLNMFGDLKSLKETSSISLTLPNDSHYDQAGEICFIDNSVKSTTDTIKIWAKFSNPNEVLNPGGVVTVNLSKKTGESAASVLPSAVMFDGKTNYVYILVDSIDDESLYKEIASDSRFAKDIEAVEKGEKSKEEFLAEFKKKRYEYEDPKTKSSVSEFNNGKVDEKYLMVLRRDVKLGPSDGSTETILSGVKPGDLIMMDGVNKARPFDLVRPFYRDFVKDAKSKSQSENKSAQKQTAEKKAKSTVTSAKPENVQNSKSARASLLRRGNAA